MKTRRKKNTAHRYFHIWVLSIGVGLLLFAVGIVTYKVNQEETTMMVQALETTGGDEMFDAICETRAVYINPGAFNTPKKRVTTLEEIKKANVNTVILASYTLKGNYGSLDDQVDQSGNVITTKEQLFEDMYNPLLARGVKVHIWLDSMRRKYPEGQSDCTTPSCIVHYTRSSEWQAHADWCSDWITKYPSLTGVHFDNLHYQNPLGYIDQAQASGIASTVRACKDAIRSLPLEAASKKHVSVFSKNVDPKTLKANDYRPAWFQSWLAANPNNFFIYNNIQYRPDNLLYDSIGGLIKPGVVSGYVASDPTTSLNLWKIRLPRWQLLIGIKFKRLIHDISWAPSHGTIDYPDGKKYPNYGYNAQAAVKQIEYARGLGAKGFAIFQLGEPGVDDTPLLDALSGLGGPFRSSAIACLK